MTGNPLTVEVLVVVLIVLGDDVVGPCIVAAPSSVPLVLLILTRLYVKRPVDGKKGDLVVCSRPPPVCGVGLLLVPGEEEDEKEVVVGEVVFLVLILF